MNIITNIGFMSPKKKKDNIPWSKSKIIINQEIIPNLFQNNENVHYLKMFVHKYI